MGRISVPGPTKYEVESLTPHYNVQYTFSSVEFYCETNWCCGVLLLLYVGSLPSPTM